MTIGHYLTSRRCEDIRLTIESRNVTGFLAGSDSAYHLLFRGCAKLGLVIYSRTQLVNNEFSFLVNIMCLVNIVTIVSNEERFLRNSDTVVDEIKYEIV